ncbi:MAG TPA: hypothetical protein VH684_11360 [Xanthobacteraceae bacterium]|jgi:hypothetical protein
MIRRCLLHSLVLATALAALSLPAAAEWKFPDWSGQWTDLNTNRWDPSRPPGAQQAPLVPEYQAALQTAAVDRRKGGRGNTPTFNCGHSGMPRSMLVYETMEIVIKPAETYMLFSFVDPLRRIYTDGRDWPTSLDPTWMGYSIGRWESTSGDGKYDTLVVETRNFRGPRILDGSGIPFHSDNQTIIRERISLDRSKPDVLLDEITLIDHAFTQPWTATRSYKRDRKAPYIEFDCRENNEHVVLGRETYLISADGFLMPTRKDQPPPDTRYFSVQGAAK